MKKTLGVCFGATSIQSVLLHEDDGVHTIEKTWRITHEGNPHAVFIEFLKSIQSYSIDHIAVTGRNFRHCVRLSSLSEPEAVELALIEERKQTIPEIVVSCGGETQLVYHLDANGSIKAVYSGNKCASGTGEFFLQQIRRMGLSLDEAIARAHDAKGYKIAGRCSVFCKSDCTHALNKGEPVENVIAGLCQMMADKIHEQIKDLKCTTILVIGGSTLNTAFTALLKKRYQTVIVPEYATVFEAYGAALWAIKNPCIPLPDDLSEIIISNDSIFSYHKDLQSSISLVTFKDDLKGQVNEGDELICGLDVGSTTTKAVLMKRVDKSVVASVYLRTNGNPVLAARTCYQELLQQIGNTNVSVVGLGVTGSGRQIAGLHALTEMIINEIIAHAKAAAHYDPNVDTIFEIGGQDAKYTFLTSGVPSDYAMNEACSAGTGSFIEESALESLNIPVKEIGEKALSADRPLDFTDQCAAFISSDIKRASQFGLSKENILAGLVYSICLNYINRVKGTRQIGKRIFMQGGVCYNRAVPIAMASLLQTPIVVPPNPGLMGAFGVALEVDNRIVLGLAKKGLFSLKELAERELSRTKSFVCAGGKQRCDRKCEITMISINDKNYPFGGACNKYYNDRINVSSDSFEQLDYVALRQKLALEEYGPSATAHKNVQGHEPRTIGINRSFLFYTLYPLYSNFFTRLGFRLVISPSIDPEGVQRVESEFCLPVEIAHGAFLSLLACKCDYIFLPQVMQVPVPHVQTYSRLCPFVQGEPYYLKTTFRKEIEESGTVILDPVLRMDKSYSIALESFMALGHTMGISKKRVRNAFTYACEKQIAFEKELKRIGKQALFQLQKDPQAFAIVLFGRPYNAFCEDSNMGITRKVASRGLMILPCDMLPVDDIMVDKQMFWAMGQKIMKAAHFVKQQENLFGFYITNFSCGPDSFLLTFFRDVMKEKPSLTLELDQHTADAGIDTRIDAAIDIIKEYQRVRQSIPHDQQTFAPLRFELPYVYTSEGKKIHWTDPSVEIVLPSFSRNTTEVGAAILRSIGLQAKALPVLDKDGFILGKQNSTGKECLPYIVTTGQFLTHLKKKDDQSKYTLLVMATGGGPCRLGQYHKAFESLIIRQKIPQVGMLTLTDENGYQGLGTMNLLKGWQGIVLADVLSDIKSMLQVTAQDPEQALAIVEQGWQKVLSYFEGKLSIRFSSLLRFFSNELSKIPLKRDPANVPIISLVGEIYVRKDEFSRKNIIDYLQHRGFMVKVAPISEYISYSNYVVNNGLGEREFNFKDTMKMRISLFVQQWWERRIKSIMSQSGLYTFELIDVAKTIDGVKHLINENFRGECILTVGLALREILHDSCGVISLGPFGCMYSRMAEAMLKREMTVEGKKRMNTTHSNTVSLEKITSLPFLSIETDGTAFPQLVEANIEAFILQAQRVFDILKPHSHSVEDKTASASSLKKVEKLRE